MYIIIHTYMYIYIIIYVLTLIGKTQYLQNYIFGHMHTIHIHTNKQNKSNSGGF